ncbi:ChbG/HpnK family deacetylase [Paenibacillus sp. MCAF9]|uniref:ChbG/HpnK family deacetylase n=1 Tax=Paenibacillus sp. MCAF9 TaxID=3233046 RepID=UPI003F9E8E87
MCLCPYSCFNWIIEGTNEAILALFQQAAITSTSIMIPCPAAKKAVNNGDFQTIEYAGIHLTLSSVSRVSTPL